MHVVLEEFCFYFSRINICLLQHIQNYRHRKYSNREDHLRSDQRRDHPHLESCSSMENGYGRGKAGPCPLSPSTAGPCPLSPSTAGPCPFIPTQGKLMLVHPPKSLLISVPLKLR